MSFKNSCLCNIDFGFILVRNILLKLKLCLYDAGMTVVNVSFAAAGFLGIYHLGVIEAILRHGDKLLSSLKACAGASAGALAATVMITAPDKLQVKPFISNAQQKHFIHLYTNSTFCY